MAAAQSKKSDRFQGWHQDCSLGSCITKTIVVNVGSTETQNQDTPVSFDDGFEAEEWEEAESYANRCGARVGGALDYIPNPTLRLINLEEPGQGGQPT